MNDPKVIVALDFDTRQQVDQLVEKLNPSECRLKVGKQLFTHEGPALVKHLVASGFDVFLDLKFHDIPNTVAKACIAAADLGVWMVNVHASGGQKMMSHTREALDAHGASKVKLIAVTVLTSMDQMQLDDVVGGISIEQQVLKLAVLSKQSGLDGVVCSAQEAQMLRHQLPNDFQLVTPGIRPAGSSADDQTRIVTPEDAINYGVDYMVVGRPITKANDPVSALRTINEQIAATR
ncbi:orotidine-5'-phosphate decarboxylase [Alteromonas oceanisediminis]|uniref:orotidine-5'-phosphate decarboxylase n=1 Tax=Alteromonas oceanisediminis TaxID=2836180 RepID=UPI001BDB04FE|nr:orotidine-5'-phosphate decarboxylase [Alteromonas oceanisediminis]MBT0586349.1 orotidine-5'-phosphate decarboxylase [Alteromonas oceanisediminis]